MPNKLPRRLSQTLWNRREEGRVPSELSQEGWGPSPSQRWQIPGSLELQHETEPCGCSCTSGRFILLWAASSAVSAAAPLTCCSSLLAFCLYISSPTPCFPEHFSLGSQFFGALHVLNSTSCRRPRKRRSRTLKIHSTNFFGCGRGKGRGSNFERLEEIIVANWRRCGANFVCLMTAFRGIARMTLSKGRCRQTRSIR